MKINVYGNTHRGLVREENEDNFLVVEEKQVFAVADGLGGLPNGAQASTIATEQLNQLINPEDDSEKPLTMIELFGEIHESVCKNHANKEEIGMATTLTIAQIRGEHLHIGHMGDSGIYLFRNGECRQITLDHTMAEEMMTRMTAEEAKNIPEYFHHTLTRCIGQAGEIEIDTYMERMEDGDQFLLYTDGVTKTWEQDELLEAFKTAKNPESIVEQIISTANERGGPDNVTAVVFFVTE